MLTLDIFNGDAFSVSSLTKAINDTPYSPGRIGELGYFSEEGIPTTSLMIERQGTVLSLVPNLPRGASGSTKDSDKRKMIPIATTHLPQRASVLADEVQGIRAFGTTTELQTVQGIVDKRLSKMRRDIDVTMEYQRIGAIKGQILDADGTTVLLDLNTTFATTQGTKSLILGTPGTNVRNKIIEARRMAEVALGNLMYKGLRCLCSQTFFDALVSHAKVESTYERYQIAGQVGEVLRSDLRAGFVYGGVIFEEYRGTVGGIDFIGAGDAYMIPEGVPDLFITNFAPADYMETVNTMGLPYYAKQELMDFNKGVTIEAQSNPISICTRPNAVIKLTA